MLEVYHKRFQSFNQVGIRAIRDSLFSYRPIESQILCVKMHIKSLDSQKQARKTFNKLETRDVGNELLHSILRKLCSIV